MTGRFAGQVALVTGSGRGIGRATASRLAAEGATVYVNDVDEGAIAATVDEIRSHGHGAEAGLADVTSEDEVTSLVDRIVDDQGRVDILVNNAGGALPGLRWVPVVETSREEFEGFLSLNLVAVFLCSRAVLPTMMAARSGRIVCVSSISGDNGQRAGAGYAAAKAGLTGLVASLAKEVSGDGVGVNAIVVGNAPHPTRSEERQALLDGWVHLARVGRYDEFAAAIAFLCSEDASYLSGTMMAVDGGFSRFNEL